MMHRAVELTEKSGIVQVSRGQKFKTFSVPVPYPVRSGSCWLVESGNDLGGRISVRNQNKAFCLWILNLVDVKITTVHRFHFYVNNVKNLAFIRYIIRYFLIKVLGIGQDIFYLAMFRVGSGSAVICKVVSGSTFGMN